MKIKTIITLAIIFGTSLCGCGFIDHPYLSEGYVKNVITPSNCETNFAIWPAHVVVLTATASVDQGARTAESFVPAAKDAYGYLILRGNGNNVMLERMVAIPKTLATPIVFVISYVVRWLTPVSDEDLMFEIKE
jgi:hypothetical protein